MKKLILIPVAIPLVIVSALLVMYLLIGGGSASSNCSSLFVTCKASCQETFLYSTAGCDGRGYFPDCQCDGLMGEQTKSISADSMQLKNMDKFIDHVAELQSTHKDDLIATLNAIKITIEYGNHEGYKSCVDQYDDIRSKLSAQQKQHLNNWLKQHR